MENCADIYARCDDANRRLCNQAFFTKVYIEEDDELRVESNRPFEMLLDSQVNADALAPGPRTPTRPEPQPMEFLGPKVRALCVGCPREDSNLRPSD